MKLKKSGTLRNYGRIIKCNDNHDLDPFIPVVLDINKFRKDTRFN